MQAGGDQGSMVRVAGRRAALGEIGTARMAYRADIDGLRAVAVLAVMLFHYGVPAVSGGFVGVDVFFVISGFLITGKLVEAWPGARTGRGLFAWLGAFYRRRILRIAPAMLAMIALVLAAGWLILAPGDYADLGESAAYSALGLGNLFFFWNTGYFDAAADTMPLLHLWSLGVEEQFYLAWPIVVAGVLVLAGRDARRARWSLLVLVAGGFLASLWLVADDPKAAFFLPFARAWELALGAALVFVPAIGSRRLAEAVVVVGLGLIFTVLFIYGTRLLMPVRMNEFGFAPEPYVLLTAAATARFTCDVRM